MKKTHLTIFSLVLIIAFILSIIVFSPTREVQAGVDALSCGDKYCTITRTSLEKIASFTQRGVIRSMFGAEQNKHQYIPLQNGLCNVTLYTGSNSPSNIVNIVSVSEAKDVFTDRNTQLASSTNCHPSRPNYCSFTLRIDDEFYMMHVELPSNGYLITNWNCT